LIARMKKRDTKTTPQADRKAQPNEGEGNQTFATRYDEEAQRFAESGQVPGKAREAADALDGDEAGDLQRAEDEGRRHIAEEDPELRR
jgi:hypothetical protein